MTNTKISLTTRVEAFAFEDDDGDRGTIQAHPDGFWIVSWDHLETRLRHDDLADALVDLMTGAGRGIVLTGGQE